MKIPFLSFFIIGLGLILSSRNVDLPSVLEILEITCNGDLNLAMRMANLINPPTAQSLHIISSFELILNSNPYDAVRRHISAKILNPKLIPPLAQLHLDGNTCGGLSDIFYVSAVILKELVDTNISQVHLLRSLPTLITLTSDSGLHVESERHMENALQLSRSQPESILTHSGNSLVGFMFRSCLMIPGVYESVRQIKNTRKVLSDRISTLLSLLRDRNSLTPALSSPWPLADLDEFSLSPSFYLVYMGLNDLSLLSDLHSAYGLAHPPLREILLPPPSFLPLSISFPSSSGRVRVGFVSSHLRRHSIGKLFCGVISGMDRDRFEVFVFSSLPVSSEDALTLSLRASLEPDHFLPLQSLVQTRRHVPEKNIQVLVYLDLGMEPATAVWAGARLAPVQVVVWGHPSTSGLPHIDYFLSSAPYHHYPNPALSLSPFSPKHTLSPADFLPTSHPSAASSLGPGLFLGFGEGQREIEMYSEQLVMLEALGFHFSLPTLSVLKSLSLLNTSLVSSSPSLSSPSLSSPSLSSPSLSSPSLSSPSLSSPSLSSSDPKEVALDGSLSALPVPVPSPETLRERDSLLLSLRPDFFYQAMQTHLNSSDLPSEPTSLLVQLIGEKREGAKIILCPQHLPKFHPNFDAVLRGVLEGVPNALLVVLSGKKKQWVRTLEARWRRTIGNQSMRRIVWLPGLSPDQYLSLLAVGDIMLDPFPFGGGVTTLEGLAVCTPVITAPALQSVPRLTAGMLSSLSLRPQSLLSLISVGGSELFVETAVRLLGGKNQTVHPELNQIRQEICRSIHIQRELFSDARSIREWERFIEHSVRS